MSDIRVPNSFAQEPRLPRVPTDVYGLDSVLHGGLPKGRATLVVGPSGSGKTLLGCELIQRAISERGRTAVLVTFEETGHDLMANVETLGWPFFEHVQNERLFVIDASPQVDEARSFEAGIYDLSGVLSQINYAADELDASLIVLDGLSGLFQQFGDTATIRRELYRIVTSLKKPDREVVLTGEGVVNPGSLSRFGVEDYVADAVIVLRQTLRDERIRRTVQVHKLRGDSHEMGEFPFAITNKGIYVLQIAQVGLVQASEVDRLDFGNERVNDITGGGVFRDSIVLIAGPTGSGKTLLSTTFADGGCQQDERVLFFGFEESARQLERNAASWGMDFRGHVEAGRLKLVCRYPESSALEGHLISIREEIEQFAPSRVVIDSISAVERVATSRLFREFVISLTGHLKEKQICAVLTSTSDNLSGGDSVTERHISTITDSIVLLRYVENAGVIRRGVVVIKMRGSQHDKALYEFSVSNEGLTVAEPFSDLTGNVLVGR